MFCKKITNYKLWKPVGFSVDNLYVQRLLNIFYLTITTFWHVLDISKIPFETVHQTLKQSVTRSRHTYKHITVVYQTVWTDWQRRFIQQLHIISISSEEMQFNMKRIRAVLLLGIAKSIQLKTATFAPNATGYSSGLSYDRKIKSQTLCGLGVCVNVYIYSTI